MNRAERRRQQKSNMKKEKTYVMTQSQIDSMIRNAKEEAKSELDTLYQNAYNEELSKLDIKKIKQEAMEEAVDVSFGLMLSIPTNVLANLYWEKSAEKRIPIFIDECLSVYESVGTGTLTISELIEDTENIGNLKMECVKRIREMRNKLKTINPVLS